MTWAIYGFVSYYIPILVLDDDKSNKSINSLVGIPRFLRVRELTLSKATDGRNFVQCSCCERTKIGVPCPCFFRVARDAEIKFDEIMDVGMFDIRYTKLFNSHYACNDETISNMLVEAQAVRVKDALL